MEFNKVIRAAKREKNDIDTIHSILDAGFLCHVGFQFQGQTMMIPTVYGRENDTLYLHGSAKNFMLNQILDGQTSCISITHLDGIVLGKSLYHTSVNYRSVVLFGKAMRVEDENERMNGMKIISDNIVKGRWSEVSLGTESQIKATLVIKFKIETASAKVRTEGPVGDETIINEVWSGVIPLVLKPLQPIQDEKFGIELEMSESVRNYINNNA